MELLMTGQYFQLMDWLIARDKKVFVDLKFFDVPETVGRTISRLSEYGATFATIHGNQALNTIIKLLNQILSLHDFWHI
jgi:orotidine-5'-phosphate decarboxylase